MESTHELIAQQINEIMDRFDFKNVRALMKKTNWTYCHESTVPSIETLKETAHMCLLGMYDSCYTSTGGFHAIKMNCRGREQVINCCKIILVFGDADMVCQGDHGLGWKLETPDTILS